ncbi:hypothetical protein CFC21_003189 [Triticum aestivum]|uniref:Uncharacterized protein n=1 Tax=Triticum aestivum TaxID=4565 RepID=A0A3B5Y3U6_WHEAT|nr:hypothetical protein CFC21_003189 [Triticum aestivum]
MAAVAAPAAEAQPQAEEPSPPRPPPPEKRAAPTDAEEGDERPEPKRRRARVAALEKVPSAAAAAAAAASEEEDDGFSFLARSFSGVETTPKFGSFNPAAAQFVAFHLARPPPLVDPAEGSPPVAVGGDGEEKGKDGNSH